MPRLPHGKAITLDEFQAARATLAERSADITLGFAAALPVVTQDFGFLFPELQQNPDNLLPEGRATRDALVDLGRVMIDDDAASGADADIPAAYRRPIHTSGSSWTTTSRSRRSRLNCRIWSPPTSHRSRWTE